MASKYWLKLYHEMLDDPKVAVLPDRYWRRMIECFLLAGDHNEKGVLPSVDHMAWKLRMDPDSLETDLVELGKLGIVEQIKGEWVVSNFDERQRPRTAAERNKLYRDRKRKDYEKGWFEDGEDDK
ncbi:hypothetical protein LCGC14_2610990 [marine sediment metagenome]|uniref:Phage replisome organiser N-terminal domain-containing protein n=1 Tax=marine sediment metagenome TaxID=412755 RepID=A0A0F9ATI7_9ZZZZ